MDSVGNRTKRIARPVSPATVIACVALAISLGGTSYAAISLPANSVGAKQLRNGAVTSRKIASATIAALHGATGATGAAGPAGPVGPTGPTGPIGAQGPAGPVSLEYVNSGPWSLLAGKQRTEQAWCPQGMAVTGGSAFTSSGDTAVTVNSSNQIGPPYWPTNPGSGWEVTMNNASAGDTTFYVDAICTTPSSVSTN
jgi:hypothetical protein